MVQGQGCHSPETGGLKQAVQRAGTWVKDRGGDQGVLSAEAWRTEAGHPDRACCLDGNLLPEKQIYLLLSLETLLIQQSKAKSTNVGRRVTRVAPPPQDQKAQLR